MFNKNSIFFTLGISFVISLFLIIFSYFLIVEKDTRQHQKSLKKRYFTVVQLIEHEYQKVGFTQALEDMVRSMGFDIVQNGKINETLMNNDVEPVFKRKMGLLFIYLLKGDKNNFLHIQAPFDEYLLIDKNVPKQEFKTISFFIFLFILSSFIFISYHVFKKLYPLNELKEKIGHMEKGEIKFDSIDINKKDEVSLLAKEFKEKSDELKNIKEARNVFIRNIMHELKTPITKGRFLAELPQSDDNKEKMKYVFLQLESLISEFASIEEVISKGSHIQKKEYHFHDILENSLDKLMAEEENYAFEGVDKKIKVNFKLFSIAVKNLIENAIKYSPEHNLKIVSYTDKIEFINHGKKLKYPLENYFEPFFNTESKGDDSFGLGLYIVNSIIEAHGFELQYEYIDGKNIFKILFKS